LRREEEGLLEGEGDRHQEEEEGLLEQEGDRHQEEGEEDHLEGDHHQEVEESEEDVHQLPHVVGEVRLEEAEEAEVGHFFLLKQQRNFSVGCQI
jgi:hypothetical protein